MLYCQGFDLFPCPYELYGYRLDPQEKILNSQMQLSVDDCLTSRDLAFNSRHSDAFMVLVKPCSRRG